MVSRRFVLGGVLAGLATPVLAEGLAVSPRPVARPAGGAVALKAGPEPGALIEAAGLGGVIGYAVADARSGQVLEAMGERQGLPPASTAKAVTALYGLERLGAGHRFVTRVLVTGPVAGGVVQGDLVLSGSGDPELDTDRLAELAARLAATGVRGVAGRFLIHDGALPSLAEIAADQPEHVGYNPAISGLNLNYNRVHFEWKRGADGWGVAMDARGERFVPPVRMARMEVVRREAPLFTWRERGGAEEWTVASAALGKGGSRWLPVRNPGAYAGEVFQTLARAQGVDLPEGRRVARLPGGQVVAELAGEPLPDVLRRMLRWSTNLTAEVVGLSSSGAGGLRASGGAMSDWARGRLGAEGRFLDHSGLGGDSRVAPVEMVKALVASQGTPSGRGLKAVLRDLGMRDGDGEAVESPVKVIGKTGTLNFVSGLVGFVQPPSGRELAFAIFCADVARRDRLSVAEREQPAGGKAWNRRARKLQGQLIARWAGVHG
ncbi:MAG: D-alanyl-D-alanine carboxypeptidase [Rhodobacter sp. CACIA14H1]|nr:MAG: D-alanyl-D-alanine carboxypeptidase [Rhodobacter sp. CACIA14H1]